MSLAVSYKHTVAKGMRLGGNSDGSFEYNLADPMELQHRAVTLVAQGAYGPTFKLAEAGELVYGSIVLVEPTDGATVKFTHDVAGGGGVVWYRYTGAAPAPGAAIMGAVGTGGDTGDGYVTTGVPGTDPGASGHVVEVDTVNLLVGVIYF